MNKQKIGTNHLMPDHFIGICLIKGNPERILLSAVSADPEKVCVIAAVAFTLVNPVYQPTAVGQIDQIQPGTIGGTQRLGRLEQADRAGSSGGYIMGNQKKCSRLSLIYQKGELTAIGGEHRLADV